MPTCPENKQKQNSISIGPTALLPKATVPPSSSLISFIPHLKQWNLYSFPRPKSLKSIIRFSHLKPKVSTC